MNVFLSVLNILKGEANLWIFVGISATPAQTTKFLRWTCDTSAMKPLWWQKQAKIWAILRQGIYKHTHTLALISRITLFNWDRFLCSTNSTNLEASPNLISSNDPNHLSKLAPVCFLLWDWYNFLPPPPPHHFDWDGNVMRQCSVWSVVCVQQAVCNGWVHTAQGTVYSVQYIVYSVQYTVHSMGHQSTPRAWAASQLKWRIPL